MILRDYQIRAIDLVRAEYRRGRKSVLLVLPTGAGKTATASQLIAWAVARGRRCLFVVHRREIVLDTARRLTAAGVPCGIVMASERPTDAAVQVCSVQTLTAREQHPPADLIVWDEAHHCAADTYREIRGQYPSAWHLGLTATPERSDGAPLGDAFEALVAPITVAELVAAGHLAPIDVVAPPTRLQSAIGATPADAWRAHGGGRPAVIFTSTIAESRECVEAIGPRAAHLDGSTPRRERDEILRRFEAGDLDVVSNCAVLTEGWDSARAEVCVLARGCGSLPVYLQTIGRVRRTGGNAAKRCLLLDLAGAAHEHGMPDDPREWSLDEGQERRAKSDREALSTCLHCGAVVRYASRGPKCRKCGSLWPEAERVEVRKQALVAVTAVASTRREREDELARLERVARERGYKPTWALVRFKERFRLLAEEDSVKDINTNPTTKQEATRMAKMANQWKANCYRFDYDRGVYKPTKRGTRFTPAERAALEEMLQRHGWRLAPEDALHGETCWKGGLGRLDEGAWSTQRACAHLFSAIARLM